MFDEPELSSIARIAQIIVTPRHDGVDARERSTDALGNIPIWQALADVVHVGVLQAEVIEVTEAWIRSDETQAPID